MSRRSLCLTLGSLAMLALGGIALLIGLIRHVPYNYARAPLPDDPAALQERSREGEKKIFALLNAIGGDPVWYEQFTDEEINSYLEDRFVNSRTDRQLSLPDKISQPRIVFGQDEIHLAFRYSKGVLSTVVSIDLRVWLPDCEPNVLALELKGIYAGALPISAQSLSVLTSEFGLERVSEVGRQNGIDVSWYRTNGHPVALLRFGIDQPRPTVLLEAVKLQPGTLAVKGRANRSLPGAAPADANPVLNGN